MRNVFRCVLLTSLLALPAAAQTSQTAAPKDPMATWLRNSFTNNRNSIVRSAGKVPEEFYSMRPGPQTEVRTFGQILGHLANLNYLWCSQARGEKNPNQGNDFEKITAKADLVKALTDAFAYCESAYTALTDSSGLEILPITQENGQQTRVPRMSLLVLNYGHNNEHYGNLVTYMRIKSIVPASSEPRPAAPAQR